MDEKTIDLWSAGVLKLLGKEKVINIMNDRKLSMVDKINIIAIETNKHLKSPIA